LLELVRKAEYVPHATSNDNPVSINKPTLPLALLPNNDLDWPDWNRIAIAIWRATDGSAEGYRLFAAWSAKSKKCGVEEQPIDTWKRLNGCRPKVISGPTILYLAEQVVPGWQQRLFGDPEIDVMIEDFYELMDAVT